MTLVQNPNQARPTLKIGAKPLGLAAFKRKLKIVEPEPVMHNLAKSEVMHKEHVGQNLPVRRGEEDGLNEGSGRTEGPRQRIEPCLADGHDDVGVIVPSIRHAPDEASKQEPAVGRKKPRPPARPFVRIAGVPVAPPEGQEHTEATPEAIAKWAWIIAREVAKAAPEGQRKAARKFAASHRRTIASAFERRLSRGDVVRALGELWRVSKSGE